MSVENVNKFKKDLAENKELREKLEKELKSVKDNDKNERDLIPEIARKLGYDFTDEEFKNIHHEEEKDIFDEKYDEKHNKNKNEEKKQNYRDDFRKKKFNFVLDPFKYNPNYNSIYRNIPSVKIIDPRKNLSTNNSRFKNRNKF